MALSCVPVTGENAEALLPILRDAEEGEERIREAQRDPLCVTYAACVDGTLVGAAVVRWESGEDSELLYIAMLPTARGKGYGQQLCAALQTELRARGGQALLVGTANCSLENIAFYQKSGFRMFAVKRDFFAYIQPPMQEHGIPMRDMLIFRYEVEIERAN